MVGHETTTYRGWGLEMAYNTEDDKELLERLKAYYNEAKEVHDEWLEKAEEDMEFYAGQQWDEDIAEKLKSEDRPVLTLNNIRTYVRLLTGYEQKTRYDRKIIPITGGDRKKAEILTGLIKQIENENEAPFLISDMYKEGLIAGRGWLKIDIDDDYEPLGEITYEGVSSEEILVDPYHRRYDMLDARYLIRDYVLDEEDLISLIPEAEDEIRAFSEDSEDSTEGRRRVTAHEFWYRTFEKRYFLIDQAKDEVTEIDKGDIQAEQMVQQDPESFSIIEKKMKTMRFCVTLGVGNDIMIQKGVSPFNHKYFPYVNYYAEFVRKFKDMKADWLGIVRDLKDPQREKNKRRSQYLDKLNREIASGYMYEYGAIQNTEPLSKLAKRPWYEIIVKPGMWGKVQKLENRPVDAALLQLDEIADKDFRDISGVNPALLGQTEGSRESGKATALRQQQGIVMLAPYQENMRLTLKIITSICLSLIGQAYSVARMARILVDTPMGTQITEDVSINPEDAMMMEEIRQISLDMDDIEKYDVYISETPTTQSLRVAQFVELIELANIGFPIPPEVMIKASDTPYKEEIIQYQKQMQQAQAQQPPQQPPTQQPATS